MSDTNSSRPFGIVAAALSQSGTSARVPRTRRLAKKRKFFEMCQVTLSSPGGYEIVNEAALFPQGGKTFYPPDGQRGFRQYEETPLFRFDTRLGREIKGLEEIDDYWLVSDLAKTVLQKVAPMHSPFWRVALNCGMDRKGHVIGSAIWSECWVLLMSRHPKH